MGWNATESNPSKIPESALSAWKVAAAFAELGPLLHATRMMRDPEDVMTHVRSSESEPGVLVQDPRFFDGFPKISQNQADLLPMVSL